LQADTQGFVVSVKHHPGAFAFRNFNDFPVDFRINSSWQTTAENDKIIQKPPYYYKTYNRGYYDLISILFC